MSPTPAQKELRWRRRRALWGSLAYVLLGVPALAVASIASDTMMVWGIGSFMLFGVIWIGGLVVSYRCPRCATPLGDDAAHATRRIERMFESLLVPAECPHCGLSEVDMDDG